MTGPLPPDWRSRSYRFVSFAVICFVVLAPIAGSATALPPAERTPNGDAAPLMTAGANYNVSSMSVPDTVRAGESVTVDATIENTGDAKGAQEVEVRVDGTTEYTETVSLLPGNSRDISTTLSLSSGDHTVTVVTADDSRSQTVSVETVDGPFFDVGSFDAPSSVRDDESVAVSATVENVGNESDTQSIEYRIDTDEDGTLDPGEAVDNQSVSLSPEGFVLVEFNNTLDVDPGTYTHGIVSANTSATAEVTIRDSSGIPTADAGEDRTVDAGTRVVLDGRNSTDSDDSLTYKWRQVAGKKVTVFDMETATAEINAPDVLETEELVFELTVSDGENTDTDTVTVTVQPTDAPPVADPGEDRTVDELTEITLNGSGSYDPDGGEVTYFWEQMSGPDVTLSDNNAERPTFETPSVEEPTDIKFRLTVTDDEDDFGRKNVTLTVEQLNDPPVADAGDDRTVDEGSTVELDATGSSDFNGDPLSYAWSQVSGPNVGISDSRTATAEFTAPDVSSETTLTFEVLVNDGNFHSDTDRVNVTVSPSNDDPVADAGEDKAVESGAVVPLDGTDSSDSDGDSLSYSWTQTGGPDVELLNADTAGPSFTAPTVSSSTTLTFELTVADGNGGTDTDTVSVTVEPASSTSDRVSRRLDTSDAVPGGQVRVTLSAEFETFRSGASILDAYEGDISGASITAIRVNGSSADDKVGLTRVDSSSLSVTFENLGAGSTVEVEYVVDVRSDAVVGDELRFTGSPGRPDVTAGDFTAEFGVNETTVEADRGEDTSVTATREVTQTQIAPGSSIDATLEASVDASVDRLAIRDDYEGAVGSVSIAELRVNGSTIALDDDGVVRADAGTGGVNVTLADVGADATVTVEYTVAVPDDATDDEVVRFTGLDARPDVQAGDAGADFGTDETTIRADAEGVARELANTEVEPGGTLTATLTAEFDAPQDSVAIVDGFTGPIASAAIESVTQNGSSKSTRFTNTNENGLTVALENVPADATVEVTYKLTVEDDSAVGSTIQFVGNDDGPDVSAGDTARNFGPDTAVVVESTGPVDRADTNGDGKIDDDELDSAIVDWSNGDYDDDELRKIIVAWSAS